LEVDVKESYTKKEVSDITGLPYRNIQFYTEQAVVVPEVEAAGGRGKFRRYSNRDLASFIIAGELAYYGMTVAEIRDIVFSISQFWKLWASARKQVPDEKILSVLSNERVGLYIGRTKDNARLVQLRQGADDEGGPRVTFSKVTPKPGKMFLNVKIPGEKIDITMDEKQKVVKDFHLHSVLLAELVSFIYIGINGLVEAAMKRMP
jgi:DNA-binding transcriptional MerR regulator